MKPFIQTVATLALCALGTLLIYACAVALFFAAFGEEYAEYDYEIN